MLSIQIVSWIVIIIPGQLHCRWDVTPILSEINFRHMHI